MLGAPSACFTCGLPVAELTPVYRAVRDALEALRAAAVEGGADPEGPPGVPPDFYEALGVSNCCRVRLAMAMDIRDELPEEALEDAGAPPAGASS